ncbi:cupin domain-containing protein [Inquilinus limosus]|uniref:cupin domain-containing protein n=1 Tax=Inquilinus limosus TaxID=171674 RepID=UPI003F170ABF
MSIDLTVGARIRALRHAQGLSLETVAARSGLSIGFVSQVERGLSSPSLKVLTTIGDVLGVGLAGLFGPAPAEGADPVVMRRTERPGLNLWRSGITKQLLSPAGDGGLSLFLVTMEPGASTGDEFYAHAGEEAGTVLEGEMALTVDAESWTLAAGDGFRFASRRPHRFANPSADAQAVVLWVNCVVGR